MYIETNNMKNLFIEAIGVQELKTIIAEAVRVELGKIDFSQKGKLEILNRVEVSKLLNVSMVTLSTWTKTGKIKAYRIGNRVYYKKLNIEEAMKEIKGSLNR
jgi:excisionase family DNA binding protein